MRRSDKLLQKRIDAVCDRIDVTDMQKHHICTELERKDHRNWERKVKKHYKELSEKVFGGLGDAHLITLFGKVILELSPTRGYRSATEELADRVVARILTDDLFQRVKQLTQNKE